MKTISYFISNGEGWMLAAKQHFNPRKLNKTFRSLLIIPGYGMNSFIFTYHPTDISLVEHLTDNGFEVWTVDLRAQGESIDNGGSKVYTIKALSTIDLPAVIKFVQQKKESQQKKIDLIGCSLGGTLVYVYAALVGTSNIASIVGLGSPLRWAKINPLVKIIFSSPRLAGNVKIKNLRTIARYALPLIAKVPSLLHIYIHPEIVDMSHPEILTKTVEDPNPQLNFEIANWLKSRDLIIDNKNITTLYSKITNPIFLILCNADGVVPPETALSALNTSSEVRDYIIAGNDTVKMAHADMYISKYARDFVFAPLAKWLITHQS